jgi:hypothetical protein
MHHRATFEDQSTFSYLNLHDKSNSAAENDCYDNVPFSFGIVPNSLTNANTAKKRGPEVGGGLSLISLLISA